MNPTCGGAVAENSELIAHIHRSRARDLKSRIWLGDIKLGHLDPEAPERMLDHLQAAAAAGDVDAFVELGDVYAEGVGLDGEVRVDDERALAAFEAGAERGHPQAARRYLRLSLMRRPGPEGAGRITRWLDWLLADDASGEAHWIAGVAARRGYGIPIDPSAAVQWLEIAAERGHSDAMWELFEIHATGHDPLQQNLQAANQWCLRAAQAGHVVAAYTLGQQFSQLGMDPANLAAAAEWFERAAHAGHAEARLALGILYMTGSGVPSDPTAAAAWFDQAEDVGIKVDEVLSTRNIQRPR